MTKTSTIEGDTFNHFREQEQKILDAIQILKNDGFIVYKRSTKSPRIYDTLGISKLLKKKKVIHN